jgi:signal transduction histidine kinase
MKKSLLKTLLLHTALLLAFNLPLPAQQGGSDGIVDSLRRIIANDKTDSNRLKAYIDIARYYFNHGNYDNALNAAYNSMAFAKAKGISKKFPKLTYNIGMIHTNLQHYDSALIYLESAEKLSIAANDKEIQFQSMNAKGNLANYQSNYSGALTIFFKALALIEKPGNEDLKKFLPQAYGNIGHNLMAENQYEKGIEYEKKILLLHGDPDELRYAVQVHLDVFDAYLQLKNLPKAKLHLDSAVEYNKKLDNIQITTLVANNEGLYYQTVKDNDKAIAAYKRAYQLCDSTGNDYLKSETCDNLASIYLANKNYEAAEKYALLGNQLAKTLQHFVVVAGTYNTLKSVAAAKDDYKNALDYAEYFKQYSDSVTNQATQKKSLSLEAIYQNQQKEKAIADLTIANTEKELQAVKHSRLLLIGGLSAAALLIVLGLLYRNSKQKQLLAQKENTLQQEQIKFLERQQQLVSLQSMVNGQETERTRIAKDLHDGLGGLFSTVKMYFSTLQHEQDVLQNNSLFTKSYELIDTASEEVRRIAHNMMPEVLMKLGLIPAIQDMCSNISAGKLLQVKLQHYGMDKRFNAATEIMLYRIIQELLNNIIKHAQASEAIVQFNRDEESLTVTVEDNGRGFNLQEVDDKNHAGLETIRSRVNYLNGNISIDSEKEIGTTVMIEFLINETA